MQEDFVKKQKNTKLKLSDANEAKHRSKQM